MSPTPKRPQKQKYQDKKIKMHQFDNEVQLNDEAIPFFVRRKNQREYHYVYARGNGKFQCRELEKAICSEDSSLLNTIAQRGKTNGASYGKFVRHFDIEGHRFFLMELLFKDGANGEWKQWAIPKKYCQRINSIRPDFDSATV